jgi:hypothetical protein
VPIFLAGRRFVRKRHAAHSFRRESGCLQRLRQSVAARRCGVHARVLAIAVMQGAAWVLALQALSYSVSDATRRRKCIASVSVATGMHEASETLSRSFALRHHNQMQANAVPQRAAWVLVLRPLNYRASDAVPMGGRRRNSGASVSGTNWAHGASETLSRSLALRHHDQMQANAVSKSACGCWCRGR